MQDFLREWSARSQCRNRPVLLDQSKLEWFAELNRGLRDPLDDAGFKARIRDTTQRLQALAREIVATARAEHADLDASALLVLLADQPDSGTAGMLFGAAA